MAEVGATVIAFLSLAKAVSAAYDAYAGVRDAPEEVRQVAMQLAGLVTIVSELQQVSSQRLSLSVILTGHIDHAITQIKEDVEKCNQILELADSGVRGSLSNAPSRYTILHAKAKFIFTGSKKKAIKLAQRLQNHRSSLALVLQIMEW